MILPSTITAVIIISITTTSCSTPVSANGAFTFHHNSHAYNHLNTINQQQQQQQQQQHDNVHKGYFQYIIAQQQKQHKRIPPSYHYHSSSSQLFSSFNFNPLPDIINNKFKNVQLLPSFSKNLFKKKKLGQVTTRTTTTTATTSTFLNQAINDDDMNKNDDPTNNQPMEDYSSSTTMETGQGINGSSTTTSTATAPAPAVNKEEEGELNGMIDPNPFLTATVIQPKNGKSNDVEDDPTYQNGSVEPNGGTNGQYYEQEEESVTVEDYEFQVDSEIDGDDVEYEQGFEHLHEKDEQEKPQLGKQMQEIVSPIFGPEIEKGVSKDTIKGALVAGAALTFLTNNFNPNAAAVVALGTAYVAITPGQTGNVVRVFGDAAWDTTMTILKTTRNLAKALNIKIPLLNTSGSNVHRSSLMGKEEIQLDEDIVDLVQEVEETVAEVENVLANSNAARDAAAEEERLIEESDRLAEEARLLELEYLLEEAKIEREAYEAEMDYLSVEAQIAEEERLAEEAALAEEQKIAEEEARIAAEEEARITEEQKAAEEEARIAAAEEEARIAAAEEEARIAVEEEARIAERVAEEDKMAEEARIADEEMLLVEEARLAEEELFDMVDSIEGSDLKSHEKISSQETDEDDLIDETDWEASIQLAESLESSRDNYEKEEWNAARQLANDLTDENELDYDAPGLTEEERMEILAEALRAAVDKSEADKQDEEVVVEKEQERMTEMKLELQKADILDNSTNRGLEETNGFDTTDDEGVEVQAEYEPAQEYETMTVKTLKEILRSQGLKVSGRKAELIERLRSN